MKNQDEIRARNEREIVIRGVTICPGIGFGMVRCVDPAITIVKEEIGPARVPEEEERYTRAVESLKEQLHEHIQQYHQGSPSEVDAILRAHEMMLSDQELHNGVLARIASGHRNAEWAIEEEGERLIGQFERARNPYFQARAEDVRDLLDHLLRILSEKGPASPAPPAGSKQDRVIVSGRLYPSDVVLAERSGACGFATESRALSSHAALLLKGFGIPSVGELTGLKETAQDGDKMIVDALQSLVVLRPARATLDNYQERRAKAQPSGEPPSPCRCMTGDGMHIHLFANIENPRQAPFALQYGLEGVGLGAMIEVPAAAIETRAILEQVDFISVGTNDLLQYFMAAERDNEEVLQYNDAENHGFLWLLEFIAGQARSLGRERDVMICGEMASRPEFIPGLLGLGYRTFSISPVSAGAVRDAVEAVELEVPATNG